MNRKTLIVGALITAAVPIAQAAAEFDPAAITDIRAWAVGIVAASVRQLGIFALAHLPSLSAE